MIEQKFHTEVINYLAGELTAEAEVILLQSIEVSAEKQKLFEEYSKAWNEMDDGEIPDVQINLDEKWRKFETVAFERERPVVKLNPWSSTLMKIASVVAILALGFWAWELNDHTGAEIASELIRIEGSSEVQEIVLPDGSRIWLDKNSHLEYPGDFAERSVRLEGKALFDVEHAQDDRSFVVNSNGSKVTVLGTVFMVDAIEQNVVEVYVEEGRVALESLDSGNKPSILTAGDKGTFDKRANTVRKEVSHEANLFSWKTGEYHFDGAPLSEVLDVLAEKYDVHFEVKNKGLLDCTFNTSFSDEELTSIFDEVTFALNVEIKELSPGKYLVTGSSCQ